jgi:hypothetical protein
MLFKKTKQWNLSQKYLLEIFCDFGHSGALAFFPRIRLVWAAKAILHTGQILENSLKIYF